MPLPCKQKGYMGQHKGLKSGRIKTKFWSDYVILNFCFLISHVGTVSLSCRDVTGKGLCPLVGNGWPTINGNYLKHQLLRLPPVLFWFWFFFSKRELGLLNQYTLVYHPRKFYSCNVYLHILEIFFLKKQKQQNIVMLKKYTLKKISR